MRLLLTNDDGIDAPGLQALCDAARPLGNLVVAAPVGAPFARSSTASDPCSPPGPAKVGPFFGPC